jgi:hypothetical protein
MRTFVMIVAAFALAALVACGGGGYEGYSSLKDSTAPWAEEARTVCEEESAGVHSELGDICSRVLTASTLETSSGDIFERLTVYCKAIAATDAYAFSKAREDLCGF